MNKESKQQLLQAITDANLTALERAAIMRALIVIEDDLCEPLENRVPFDEFQVTDDYNCDDLSTRSW